MKDAIDRGDLDDLFELATEDVLSFFGKLSARQLGKKRAQKLYTQCKTMDKVYEEIIGEDRRDKFVVLILARLSEESLWP